MKYWIVAIYFLCAFSQPATANGLADVMGDGPKSERMAVLQTLNTYLTVTDEKDHSAIEKSFHPTALLMSVSSKGALRSLTQDFWWERVSQIPEDQAPRTSKILIIDVSGHAAIARIDITNGGDGTTSTDYFNLQKTSAGWRIVNKTLSKPI
ncbi:nuclear transport factor 2 family protein [Parasphingorhabdus cellanae]|uniref:Nuclear transport factor 2 family protein n=1 Tax=Parasphingorhabdus cellanae TaxID=2806553 RepID=A0ABX7T6W6_9SPHN|nr:nuclear transport factor 2 family protein [Parasphingorhabdus cellanae]QTD57336.1 nuclear transport factor 2 family protein [Parasphingorhabdus cellanae]